MEAATALIADPVLHLYGMVPRPIELPELEGVERGSNVFLVTADDIACAVSIVSASEYEGPAAADHSQQEKWIERAVRHHHVLVALHAVRSVVPLKFGSLSPGVASVEDMLRDLRAPVVRLLRMFEGKDEWTLRILANRRALADALVATDPELAVLHHELAELSEGHAFFARKRLQALVDRQVARRLAVVTDAIHERLSRIGLHAAATPPPKPAANDATSCVAATAILVERANVRALDAALIELEAEHADAGVTFELAGPWPPYSFATTLEQPSAGSGSR